VISHHDKRAATTGQGDTVRVASNNVVNAPGTNNPKAVVSFYETSCSGPMR